MKSQGKDCTVTSASNPNVSVTDVLQRVSGDLQLGIISDQEVLLNNILSTLTELRQETSSEAGFAHLLLSKYHIKTSRFDRALLHIQIATILLQNSAATMECAIALCAVYRRTGQFLKAQESLSQCVPSECTEVLRQDFYLEQGLLKREMGQYQEAERYFMLALDLALYRGDERKVEVIKCYHALGTIYCILGRYHECRTFLTTCISALETLCPVPNLLETELWHDFAFLNLVTARQVEAEIFICKSLYARKRLLGKGSVGLVKSYILFGNVFQEAAKPIRAEKAYVKAITISNLCRGPHIDTGTAYLSLASLYTRQNEPKHALKNVETGYKLLKPYLNSSHADRANAYTILAAVFSDNGKPAEALHCWNRAQKIYATSLPEEHDYVKLAKTHMSTIDPGNSSVQALDDISSDLIRGCVEQFDHHCKWLNNCIGQCNYRWFWVLILSLALSVLVQIVFAVVAVISVLEEKSEESYISQSPDTALAFLSIDIVVSALVFVAVTQLICLHAWLISKHLTTYEWIKSKRLKKSFTLPETKRVPTDNTQKDTNFDSPVKQSPDLDDLTIHGINAMETENPNFL